MAIIERISESKRKLVPQSVLEPPWTEITPENPNYLESIDGKTKIVLLTPNTKFTVNTSYEVYAFRATVDTIHFKDSLFVLEAYNYPEGETTLICHTLPRREGTEETTLDFVTDINNSTYYFFFVRDESERRSIRNRMSFEYSLKRRIV